MSELEDFVPETQEAVIPAEDELAVLKRRAAQLNLTFHPNIGVETLRKRIDEYLSDEQPEKDLVEGRPEPGKSRLLKDDENAKRIAAIKDAAKLVRINVTPMDPKKRDWPGEVFTVSNAQIGTFKKYIPFNTTEGWHVPNVIYKQLKHAKAQIFKTVTDRRGNKVRKGHLINAFAIEVLDPLTKEELAELRAQQRAAADSED